MAYDRPVLALILALALAPAPAEQTTQPQDAPSPAPHQHDMSAHGDLFPARESSGTAWLPDETPMHGASRAWRGWAVVMHGSLFTQFLYEPADPHRTGGATTHQFSAPNWGMVMARRKAGSGRLGVRAMLSLDPLTIPGCGYINMLATGEACEGDTIHDRQHPHDLFMELAADYDRELRGRLRWTVYGGLAGEPALGPVGFPHRPSAALNPIAPIGHHWLDATHLVFGVVTAGIYDSRWKAEVSAFNGREPDEHRFGLDLAPLDSFSGRLSFLPTPRLALQISAGHLKEAELEFEPQPRADVARFTASATYHRPLAGGVWASTLAMGLNSAREPIPEGSFDARTLAWLFETTAALSDRDTFFGRIEIVEKPAHDLHAHEFPTSIFTVAKLQAGYVREFGRWSRAATGIGASASVSLVPPELESRYGGSAAPGFGVFFSLRPRGH
jgi:hypothetical protein